MEENIFAVEHDPDGDILRSYDGMTQDAVTALIGASGHPYEFISEDDYASRLAAQQALQANKG